MLNSSEEDFNLAVETIINLDLYEGYIPILIRCVVLNKRSDMIKRIRESEKYNHSKAFAWVSLKVIDLCDKIIKENTSDNYKKCFEYFIAKFIAPLQSPLFACNFIDNIEIKIKW